MPVAQAGPPQPPHPPLDQVYIKGMGYAGSGCLFASFTGPFDEDYHFTDDVEREAYVWSPCKADNAVNFNNQLQVSNAANMKGSGLLTTDVINHKVTMLMGLVWQRC